MLIVKLQDPENSVHHNLFCNLTVPNIVRFCNKLAEACVILNVSHNCTKHCKTWSIAFCFQNVKRKKKKIMTGVNKSLFSRLTFQSTAKVMSCGAFNPLSATGPFLGHTYNCVECHRVTFGPLVCGLILK